jgi:hypothetical protein
MHNPVSWLKFIFFTFCLKPGNAYACVMAVLVHPYHHLPYSLVWFRVV